MKGQKIRHEKRPAWPNRIVAISATIVLSSSAVGFITSGAMPASAMTAPVRRALVADAGQRRRTI